MNTQKRLKKPVFTSSDWTIPDIEKGWEIINKLAKSKYQWEGYSVQFEILSSAQFIDMETSHFMPTFYSHWSFGKKNIQAMQEYQAGHRGLAYEVIVNTSPSICYIHEDNNMMMQLLVSAHAAVGHNHFFKNNYLFREWTHPDFINDELLYAKHYIKRCEERYGIAEVSTTLDIAHLLQYFSIFKYNKKEKSSKEYKERTKDRFEDIMTSYDPVIDGAFERYRKRRQNSYAESCHNESENILYFLENATPYQSTLASWQKEIFSIIRSISQYFYPQMQTKMMNEGFASFCHYTLMNDLYDAGYIGEGYMLEFIQSHTSVVNQGDFNREGGNSINPYYLGFNMFQEIKRICEKPTEEDIQFCPSYCNTNWIETINSIVKNYRDESFIREFLTPNLIRKLKLFSIETGIDDEVYTVGAIQKEEDYNKIRNTLAEQYSWEAMLPEVEIRTTSMGVDRYNSERAELGHSASLFPGGLDNKDYLRIYFHDKKNNMFNQSDLEVLYLYIKVCWKHDVSIYVVDSNGISLQWEDGEGGA